MSKSHEILLPCLHSTSQWLLRSFGEDGVEKLDKSAKIAYEDFDICVTGLHADFLSKHETMQPLGSPFLRSREALGQRGPMKQGSSSTESILVKSWVLGSISGYQAIPCKMIKWS